MSDENKVCNFADMKKTSYIHAFFIAVCFVTLSTFSSCGNKSQEQPEATIDTIPMMVLQIQKCNKLYTTEYHVHKIVTHNDEVKLKGSILKQDFSINLPLGKRKIAIPMDVTLKAYVDLSKLTEKNIKRSGDKIEIILPDPKVMLTSSKIDHEGVKQFVALTRSNFSDEELLKYEKQGRDDVIKSIPKMGIIRSAQISAANTLIPLIQQMGYKEENIKISFRKEFNLNDLKMLFDQTSIEK